MNSEILQSLQVAKNNRSRNARIDATQAILGLLTVILCFGIFILCKENQINHMEVMHELALLKQQLP